MTNPTTVARIHTQTYRNAEAAGHAVYIGRPSKWGNPYQINPVRSRTLAIAAFRNYWYAPAQAPLREQAVLELQGKVLGCYCTPDPCHGDIIADYVNAHAPQRT